jgi:hypothetical protein
MKKAYTKPVLVRRDVLGKATAQSGSPPNIPPSKENP